MRKHFPALVASIPFFILTLLIFGGFALCARSLAVTDPLERGETTGSDRSAKPQDSGRQRLSEATDIEGVPCHRHAWFTADGRLDGCILSRDAEIAGLRLPAETKIEFGEDGHPAVCFLSRDTELEGHICRGKGHGFMTTFHPNGRLRLCWLAQAEEIQGALCKPASIPGEMLRGLTGRPASGVYFHDNGRLESCRLAREVTIGGERFSSGERIYLDPEGRPTPSGS